MSDNDEVRQALSQMGEIKGQLTMMMAMMQQHHADTGRRIEQSHADTNRRIDDLHRAQEARIGGIEGRVVTLEKNERGTAIKAGIAGATTGMITAAAIAAMKFIK
jgi:hypothetical protein